MRFGNLFRDFINSEKASGIILFLCTIVSLLVANSAFGPSYLSFWVQNLDLSFGPIHLDLSVQSWINDLLMAVFFLLVGLEIEREIYIGELRKLSAASLPIAGAIGGMLVPALIYLYFNYNTPTSSGYGIPMATDIAFALGVLSLAGNRVPHSLKVFLTALAIIDDLGAIIVIAIFYNTGISWAYLAAALAVFGLLLVMNRLKVYKLSAYLFPGILLWYFMHQSGVHATLSGVMLAFAIPFGKHDDTNISYRLQHWLHKPVAFFILPLFALANTGLILGSSWLENLSTNYSVGIIAGLVFGKPVGIVIFCWILTLLKWGRLPRSLNWKQLAGAGMLGGIGFTMSIFISNLAFTNPEFNEYSKLAVLVASIIAALIGFTFLTITNKPSANSSD